LYYIAVPCTVVVIYLVVPIVFIEYGAFRRLSAMKHT
jgi:hypothetical protein